MRLLLLEDDYRLRQAFVRRLRSDGYAVDEATTIAAARMALAETTYDCALLDRLVPDGDAIQLVETLSTQDDRPPILLLSGLATGESRVDGLESGADDYLSKPVDLDELIVRVRKLIVRWTSGEPRIQVGRASLDRIRRQVRVDGEIVHLTPTQHAVFEQLVLRADRVVPQHTLLEHCWDAHRDPFANPLHSQITRLRSVFAGVLVIESIRNMGYVLRAVAADR